MKYYILESWDGALFFIGNANPEKTIVNGELVAYTTNYYRWYSEYENKTPYTPSTLGVEAFYPMTVFTSSGEPFAEVTKEDFYDEISYYKERGMLVMKDVVKPIKKLEFNGSPDCQRGFIEDIVHWMGYINTLRLWNKACEWFGLTGFIKPNSDGLGFINMSSGQFNEDYYNLGVDDDTIADYLIDAMEHGELSILNDGTIKL